MGEASYTAARTLRVDVEKLDRLLDLAGELTIARGRVAQMLEAKEEISLEELRDAHSFSDSLHYELQDTISASSYGADGTLFHQYNRTVRDHGQVPGQGPSFALREKTSKSILRSSSISRTRCCT